MQSSFFTFPIQEPNYLFVQIDGGQHGEGADRVPRRPPLDEERVHGARPGHFQAA